MCDGRFAASSPSKKTFGWVVISLLASLCVPTAGNAQEGVEETASSHDSDSDSDSVAGQPESDAHSPGVNSLDVNSPDINSPNGDDEARLEVARNRFLRGLALADRGDCVGAIAEFNVSLRSLRRPSTLFNIARCQERLHRYDLAVAAYAMYLEEAPAGDADRAAAEHAVDELGRLIGTVVIRTNTSAEVWADGRMVGVAPGEILIPGGVHSLELRAADWRSERREIELSAGQRLLVDVPLTTVESATEAPTTLTTTLPTTLSPTLTLSLGAGAGAFLITGIVLGVIAVDLSAEAGSLDPRLPRDTAAIDRFAVLADVFWVGGAVLGAATVALAFLTDWDTDDSAHISVLATPSAVGAHLRIDL